ncbi:hypothetical protein ACLI36_35455, partial [Pseudomonas aeruginosa]
LLVFFLAQERIRCCLLSRGLGDFYHSQGLAELAADTGLQPLDLPMQEAYCIDLAFPLEASR